MSSKDKVASWRASLSKEERDKLREKDREGKARKRQTMSEEDKEKIREKDRLRKAKKKEQKEEANLIDSIEKWQMRVDHDHLVNWERKYEDIQQNFWHDHDHHHWVKWESDYDMKQQKYWLGNPVEPIKDLYIHNEREYNRLYKVNLRSNQTSAEREFERIHNLLTKRQSRALRSDEKVQEDNAKAKEGMEYEKILPFETRRRYKCRDEYLWWRFWNLGDEFKSLLKEKLPEFATKFSEWDSKKENPYVEVDGVDEGVDIDDDTERTPEQLRQLRNERLKKRRLQIREQLNQPIEMPEFEKSEYELIRERNIAEREKMMKEAEEKGDFDVK